jgi:hypothetical protein
MATKNDAAKKAVSAVGQQVLYALIGRAEKVVASFAEDLDDLELHLQAAKMRLLNQAQAEGRDVTAIKFRVASSTEG